MMQPPRASRILVAILWLLSTHLKSPTCDDSEEFHGFAMNGGAAEPRPALCPDAKTAEIRRDERFAPPDEPLRPQTKKICGGRGLRQFGTEKAAAIPRRSAGSCRSGACPS